MSRGGPLRRYEVISRHGTGWRGLLLLVLALEPCLRAQGLHLFKANIEEVCTAILEGMGGTT